MKAKIETENKEMKTINRKAIQRLVGFPKA